MSRFKYVNDIIYPEMESVTAASGSRVYTTPYGPAPSVTTILSTLPHPGLDEWRERVGEEEANRVSKEATDIGSAMHDMLEAYVRKEEFQPKGIPEEAIANKMFRAVRMLGLRALDEVWGIEVPLYYEDLYAGRTDLVGVFNGKPSIIDYKTAKYFKKDEWIQDYFLQTAAYAIAHDWMFPDYEIEQAVLIIGTRPNPEYNVPPKCQIVTVETADLEINKDKWVDVLDGYYQNAA
jgi:ATP-dependent exoDNAse (exonuclease V) beta subunit